MEDELNIDPRETDYFDDYNMEKAMNFFELKQQLADLGFNDAGLVNNLRNHVMAPEPVIFTINCREHEGNGNELRTWFEYDQHPNGDYQLKHFETLFSIGQEDINRLFEPDITRTEALAVLYKDQKQGHDIWQLQRPMSRGAVTAYIAKSINNYSPKINTMNDQNLNYLQKQLLNLGFGEGMNAELEKQIQSKTPEFTLNSTNEYNKQPVDYSLHYKAGEQNDMYFFNRYDAKLNDKQQTFYINKGSGITAKEAYNLMEGRAVHKELENKEGEKYKAWVVLDPENRTENGNLKMKTFSDGWNYKPERAIDVMNIVGINEEGAREKLMKSIEKGNNHQVEAIRDGKTVKVYLAANPAEHRLDITNWKGEPQKLEHYKKAEQKQSPDEPVKKKQSKGAKMKV